MSFKETEVGKIPLDWDVAKLGDVADVLSGFAFKSKDFIDNGVPVIKIKNIVPPYVTKDDAVYVSQELYESSEKYQLNYNDILISMTGSNYNQLSSAVGKVGRVRLKDEPMLLNQRVGKIITNEKKCNKEFLYYNISTMETRYRLALSAGGSANQANVSPKQIKSLIIPYPPLEEQKAIAHILSTLDDKIEVNNQINKTLENMAQAIFKQWFVDFEFPNEDGEPYKSSGGEMIESELGMIPKGWEVGDFSDVVEFIGGFSFMSKDYLETGKYKVITIKNVLDGKFDSSSVKYLDTIPEKMKDVQKLEKGDILMSLTGNVARVCIVSENDCLLNQRVAKIQEKSNFSRGYIYVLFRSQLVKEILLAIAKGTAQLNLSPVEAQKMKIIIPCDKVIDKISVIYDSLFNLLLQSTDEIKLLEKLRDSLLPKLMSGEIRVLLEEEGDAS